MRVQLWSRAAVVRLQKNWFQNLKFARDDKGGTISLVCGELQGESNYL
jgi:hypothetical protein